MLSEVTTNIVFVKLAPVKFASLRFTLKNNDSFKLELAKFTPDKFVLEKSVLEKFLLLKS